MARSTTLRVALTPEPQAAPSDGRGSRRFPYGGNKVWRERPGWRGPGSPGGGSEVPGFGRGEGGRGGGPGAGLDRRWWAGRGVALDASERRSRGRVDKGPSPGPVLLRAQRHRLWGPGP